VVKCLGGNTANTSPGNVVKDKTVLGLSDFRSAVLAREHTGLAASGEILFSYSLFQKPGILSVDHWPWGIA